MPVADDGHWAVSVIWAMTAVTFIFVVLRTYTRLVVVRNFGIDDHVYNFAFVSLLLFTIFMTISAHYGFGQNMRDVPDFKPAILYELIGQTFVVLGMIVAKWSLGLFLLRLVTVKWHKVAIWINLGLLAGVSIAVFFVMWLQCTPPAYGFDRTVTEGSCDVDTLPVAYCLTILCAVTDFFFAFFPWVILWKLQMRQREKILIGVSLSLGVFAGACGIKRTLDVPKLASKNILKDTVTIINWSHAEIAVTLICIAIPVCRPLLKRWVVVLRTKLSAVHSSRSGGSSRKRKRVSVVGGSGARAGGDEGGEGAGVKVGPGPVYALRTFGGGTMPGAERHLPGKKTGMETEGDGKGSIGSRVETTDQGAKTRDDDSFVRELKLGINGPFNQADAVGGSEWDVDGNVNGSQEEILGVEGGDLRKKRGSLGFSKKRKSTSDLESGKEHERGEASIQVTEEWRVDRSGR